MSIKSQIKNIMKVREEDKEEIEIYKIIIIAVLFIFLLVFLHN